MHSHWIRTMTPTSKGNKAMAPVAKKRGRAVKWQSTPPPPTHSQCMKDLMKSMGVMLHSLSTRMGTMESTAASHAGYMTPSEGYSMQTTGPVATPPTPMVADMLALLFDVSDAVRAQVTRRL